MKYDWDNMSETQKIKATEEEVRFATHNGTTKEDLINIFRWLWEEFEICKEE